jgi:small conductance mechanosensitive channel
MKKHSRYLSALTLLLVVGFLAGPAVAQTASDANATGFKIPTKLDMAAVGQIWDLILRYGVQIIGAILIYVVGKWLARVISKIVMRSLTKAKFDPTLVPFVENLSYAAMMVFVVITALSTLGVQMTSVVAVLGAAGLAVGLALQGSLANFASGVLLLIFKPFKVGDYIKAAGTEGSVKAIHIFNTILTSPDNMRIIVPNSQVTGGNITNVTAHDTRRIDLVMGVSYDDDLKKAQRVIESVLAADSRVLPEPAPQVAVSELSDSSVNFVVRPWVKTSDYWAVRFDLTARIKVAFDENGITVPFTSYQLYVKNGNGDALLKAPAK